ncbi:hypothetical protein ACVILL_001155 [Bradyrhizobium sp. USDA 3364]
MSCWLDVLFLRRQPRGSVWNHGDIGNRLKTLFDSLQIPDANQGYDTVLPADGETPFYCRYRMTISFLKSQSKRINC